MVDDTPSHSFVLKQQAQAQVYQERGCLKYTKRVAEGALRVEGGRRRLSRIRQNSFARQFTPYKKTVKSTRSPALHPGRSLKSVDVTCSWDSPSAADHEVVGVTCSSPEGGKDFSSEAAK